MINAKRINPGPKILPNTYRTTEILRELGNVFRCKCYLCEEKYSYPESLEVDHFIGQAQDPSKIDKWENLYLACKNCNQIKPKKRIPKDGYLDPCDPQDDVETEIKYELTDMDHEPMFLYVDKKNKKAINSVNLLDRVHKGTTKETKNKCEDLKKAIATRARQLQKALLDFHRASSGSIDEQKAKKQIKQITSKDSPYTMLMRSLVIEKQLRRLFD